MKAGSKGARRDDKMRRTLELFQRRIEEAVKRSLVAYHKNVVKPAMKRQRKRLMGVARRLRDERTAQ